MIGDGIFNISKMVELLCTDFMRIDITFGIIAMCWDIGEYTQKKIDLHSVSITYYNPGLKPRLYCLHSRYFQRISAALFFMITFATGSSVPSWYLYGIKTWEVYRQWIHF